MNHAPTSAGSRLLRILFAVSLALAICTPAIAAETEPPAGEEEPDSINEAPTDDQVRPFIYNGDPTANPGWVASITYAGAYFCAGTLIHAQWVLTAAHCVDDVDSLVRVNVGGNRWFEGSQRKLSQVHIHPLYQSHDISSVDLAMVRLSSPIPGATVPNLVSSANWPIIGQTLIVLGWGETSDGSSVPDFLQGAAVFVNSDTTGVRDDGYPYCNNTWVAASGYEDFCFGGVSWACPGDSGGPLVGRSSPNAGSGSFSTLYGVTSFGDAFGCSSAFWDSGGQAIGPHLDWIRSFYTGGAGDEMFFYRDDGLYRYYDVRADGRLGSPIREGDNYTEDWSSITAVDLDGNGKDEMFFYRDDGLYRYYNVKGDASLGSPIRAGDNYTSGWDSITAVDLDGDGKDEMFFYRDDGLYRYYDISANGTLGSPIRAGGDYTEGWSSITAIDLDGDGKDEMFFYRDDGLYRYYNTRSDGRLGSPIRAGSDYTNGWSAITAVNLGD